MIALLSFYSIIITIIISKHRCRLLQRFFSFQNLEQKTVHKTTRQTEKRVFASDLRLSVVGMLVYPLGRLKYRCTISCPVAGRWQPALVIKKKIDTCVYFKMSTYYLKKSHIFHILYLFVRTRLVAASVLCYWVQGRNTLHFVFSFSLTS